MSASDVPDRLQHIVVIGDGAAAWMAAAELARALGRACTVRVVPAAAGRAGDGFGADTLLPLPDARLGLWQDEDRLVGAAGGAFGWGVALDGWSARDRTWFLPFGTLGANLGPVPFHQLVLRLRRDGRAVRLADYSLCALAAQAGRFARPVPAARSVLSTCRYALHVDADALALALRERADDAGAARVNAPFVRAERAPDGNIAAVHTADGARHAGQLFLDCSESGLLAGDAAWEDWSHWLACDRALVARVERRPGPPPYAIAAAHAAGWTRHVPLGDATELVALHGAGGEAAAHASLRGAAGASGLGRIRSVPLRCGRRAEPWRGNCVALGPAAAFVDPLSAGNLHFVQTALARLLELLPAEPRAAATRREYNRRTAAELDCARDQAIALYKTNGRHGEPFWDERRAMALPQSLDYRLRVYASRGKVVQYDEEPFEEASWIALFDEQGVAPPRNHPMADGFAAADLDAHVARIRAIMIEELKRMPSHAEYLARLHGGRKFHDERSAPGMR